jgi:hypothetical protein
MSEQASAVLRSRARRIMVGKIYIKCAGGYHPDMGKRAIDPELAKREAREKARAARQQASAAREAGRGALSDLATGTDYVRPENRAG